MPTDLALDLPDLGAHLPAVLFFAFSALAVAAAVVAATARKIVHAAFGLMAAFFGVGGLYALLGADFVAFSQVLVYVGGILILLVFGILLTGRVRGTLGLERAERSPWALAVGAVLLLGLGLAISSTSWPSGGTAPAEPEPTTAAIGRAFLDPQRYIVPFELVSVLLLAGLIGAAYLARRRRAP